MLKRPKVVIIIIILMLLAVVGGVFASGSFSGSEDADTEETAMSEADARTEYCSRLTKPDPATLYFKSDSATSLNTPAKELLMPFIDYLDCNPGTMATVYGHAASVGTASEQKTLSKQRASTIAQYMVNQNTSPERLKTEARGSIDPLGDNSTEEGRARNRRVVIVIN